MAKLDFRIVHLELAMEKLIALLWCRFTESVRNIDDQFAKEANGVKFEKCCVVLNFGTEWSKPISEQLQLKECNVQVRKRETEGPKPNSIEFVGRTKDLMLRYRVPRFVKDRESMMRLSCLSMIAPVEGIAGTTRCVAELCFSFSLLLLLLLEVLSLGSGLSAFGFSTGFSARSTTRSALSDLFVAVLVPGGTKSVSTVAIDPRREYVGVDVLDVVVVFADGLVAAGAESRRAERGVLEALAEDFLEARSGNNPRGMLGSGVDLRRLACGGSKVESVLSAPS